MLEHYYDVQYISQDVCSKHWRNDFIYYIDADRIDPLLNKDFEMD